MKKTMALLVCVGVFTFLFSACGLSSQPTSPTDTTATEKQGSTTLTGSLMQANGQYYLNRTGQPAVPVDTYSADLSSHVGQTVTVTGQYSGDTLFVDTIN